MTDEKHVLLTALHPIVFGEKENRILDVEKGCVELFLIKETGETQGRRYHLASFPEGSRLFDVGFHSWDDSLAMLAVGQADTVVRISDGSQMHPLVNGENTHPSLWMRHLNHWMTQVTQGISQISADASFTHAQDASAYVPPTWDASEQGDDWEEKLSHIHASWMRMIREKLEERHTQEYAARERRIRLRESTQGAAWEEIASVLTGDRGGAPASVQASSMKSLGFAFERVARLQGMIPHLSGGTMSRDSSADGGEILLRMARESSVRIRTVLLEGDWFRRNNGPLIGFLQESGEAVALVPARRKGYLLDQSDGSCRPINKKNPCSLHPFAYFLYRSLPDRKLSLRDIVHFSVWGNKGDAVMLLGMIVLTGLLGLLTPAFTGRIFDLMIPQAERQLMMQIGVALVSAAFIRSMLELVRGMALVRIQNRTDANLQAAVWDRLLKLPVRFFRKYTSGDMATRAQGISEMHDILSSAGTTALFALPVGLFNFIVMFQYNTTLSFWGLALALLALGTSTLLNARQTLALRKQYEVQGKLAGLVFQLINGVAKFRIACAEHLAFGTWAKEYAQQERYAVRAGRWGVASHTFFSGYTLFTSLMIFAVVADLSMKGSEFTTGTFLAFNAAFGALVGSLISMGDHSLNLLRLLPLMERTKPIFDAEPEVARDRMDPGKLTGNIELAHIRFRYAEDAPPTLENFSLRIRSGEFVALVGPSGSGKSTILRLLLGFESPESGTIFYDSKDLQTLDPRVIRGQIGVVMQRSHLIPGDIFRNIVGESSLTLDDAWRAAEMAGLADDIRRMPMQMHTVISEGGGGFSGGQRQRLAIARALVHSPGILFFDEATSALDNRTQAIVTESLEKLRATRLIIAHRLSTIMQADRIVVLRHGRIIEDGTYENLMAAEGFFYELASRQLASNEE